MEIPPLFVDDKIEMCDGHSDYGYSILYCETDGIKQELYRTSYRTNRMNEPMEGIFSLRVERKDDEWIATIELTSGEKTFSSKDGRNWRRAGTTCIAKACLQQRGGM
jgi:hypothetical protein